MVMEIQDAKIRPGYKLTEVGVIPEDWEVQTLGQLGELKNGINKGKTDFGHGLPFVNLLDVFGVISISKDSELGLVDSTDTERKMYSLKKGDVLFVRSSVKPEGVGLTTLVVEDLYDTVFSGFLIRFRDKGDLAFEFKEHCFGQFGFRYRLIANSTVSANTNINQVALKKLQITFPPSKEEQRTIAKALSDIDALITSLDKLIAKKRDIKQATMQQLLTGKVRLPDFSKGLKPSYKQTEVGIIPEDWDVKKLGEIGECIIGLTYRPSDVASDGLLVLRSSNIAESGLIFTDNVFVNIEVSDKLIVCKDDILICVRNGSRNLIGKCALIDDRTKGMTFGAFMSIFRTKYAQFIFYQFQSGLVKRQINENIGATINQITNKNLKSFQIPFPSIPEQQAIATVLTDMDAEIAALEQRREKTRMLKQGMMQELLTGKTRLL